MPTIDGAARVVEQGAPAGDKVVHLPKVDRQEKRLRLVPFDKITPDINKAWLVEGLLEPGKLSAVFGAPKEGKTFIITDLALHVALGLLWFGRRVTQGAVIYIAAEGAGTIKERIEAFRQHHGLNGMSAPFYLLPGRFSAMDAESVDALIQEARAVGASLIVLDTVARVMAGHDENSQKDMGAFVDACDRVREETGAHVLVVHHAGKDERRGARGSNVLLGAVDGEMKCAKLEDRYVLKDTNTRGRAGDSSVWFQLKSVDLGQDVFGNVFDSAVVVPAAAGVEEQAGKLDCMQVVTFLRATGPISKKRLLATIKLRDKPDANRTALNRALKKMCMEPDENGIVHPAPGDVEEDD